MEVGNNEGGSVRAQERAVCEASTFPDDRCSALAKGAKLGSVPA